MATTVLPTAAIPVSEPSRGVTVRAASAVSAGTAAGYGVTRVYSGVAGLPTRAMPIPASAPATSTAAMTATIVTRLPGRALPVLPGPGPAFLSCPLPAPGLAFPGLACVASPGAMPAAVPVLASPAPAPSSGRVPAPPASSCAAVRPAWPGSAATPGPFTAAAAGGAAGPATPGAPAPAAVPFTPAVAPAPALVPSEGLPACECPALSRVRGGRTDPSAVRAGIGSVCGSSSAAGPAVGRGPAVAGRIQSMPASCHAAADCCHTETGGAGTACAGARGPDSPGTCRPGSPAPAVAS